MTKNLTATFWSDPGLCQVHTIELDIMTSVDIFHKIICLHKNGVPDRQTEWKLLRTAWLTRPHQFELSEIHVSPGDARRRITVGFFPDYHDRNHYCLYHIYLSNIRWNFITHIEGAGSGRATYTVFKETSNSFH
jgi:hypothetical protein